MQDGFELLAPGRVVEDQGPAAVARWLQNLAKDKQP